MQRLSLLALFFALSSCASLPSERTLSSENAVAWTIRQEIETATVDDGELILVRADPLVTPLQLINSRGRPSATVAQTAAR